LAYIEDALSRRLRGTDWAVVSLLPFGELVGGSFDMAAIKDLIEEWLDD
jgi:hypothetical protein